MPLLSDTADRADRYLAGLESRPVLPAQRDLDRLADFLAQPLPDGPAADDQVLAWLDELGSPATAATAGPRYFGLVIGGALPASLAANWLASAWDQNAGLHLCAPAAA